MSELSDFFPRFLLNDKNGYALACALLRGMTLMQETVDATGGQAQESDDAYRERIRTYGLASTTTGPQSQYESVAKNVSSEIIDARALNLGAGELLCGTTL